jgi:hypothetical protein
MLQIWLIIVGEIYNGPLERLEFCRERKKLVGEDTDKGRKGQTKLAGEDTDKEQGILYNGGNIHKIRREMHL